jgi:hypothetical protein
VAADARRRAGLGGDLRNQGDVGALADFLGDEFEEPEAIGELVAA